MTMYNTITHVPRLISQVLFVCITIRKFYDTETKKKSAAHELNTINGKQIQSLMVLYTIKCTKRH